MQYSHSSEKAGKYAESGFKRLTEEKLKPTPENFELWYVYYSGEHPDICHSIDMLSEKGQGITDQDCEALYNEYLNKENETDRVRAAGNRIKNTIDEVQGVVTNAQSTTTTFNQRLNSASGRLDFGMSGDDVNAIVQAIKNDAKSVLEQNEALEIQLVKSAGMMAELQEDLEQVRKEAMTDGLTKIGNRKAFDTEIERLINETAYKEDETFSLILFDIDHFKLFNDTYGHRVGDQVLKLVARTLVEGIKGKDTAVRYGGEEFALLLPDTNSRAAEMLANKLRLDVESKEVVNRNTGDKMGKITISGGIAQFRGDEGINDFIDRADTGLYKSKNKGRNCVTIVDNID